MSEFDPRLRSEPAQPQPQDAPRPSRRSALLLWLIAGLGLVLSSFLSIPVLRLLAGADEQLRSLAVSLVYYLPFMALPLFVLARRREGVLQSFRPYNLSVFHTFSVVTMALLGVFLFTDVSALWSILLEALGLPLSGSGIAIPTDARGLVICILDLAVLAPVCEEFLFRGAVLSAYERYGSRHGIWVAALTFALLHGSVEGLPVQLLVGLILGWLTVCYDSIYAGLIYHTTHNAATVILEYLALRSYSAGELAQPASMLEAIGGGSGLARLAVECAVLGALMLFSMNMARITSRLRGVQFVPEQPRPHMKTSERLLLAACVVLVALLFAASIWASLRGGA